MIVVISNVLVVFPCSLKKDDDVFHCLKTFLISKLIRFRHKIWGFLFLNANLTGNTGDMDIP